MSFAAPQPPGLAEAAPAAGTSPVAVVGYVGLVTRTLAFAVDAAIINTNYAIQGKLDPAKDAIARESAESPYVNVIAVRKADADKPWVKKLVAAWHSEEVRSYVNSKYVGVVVAGF